MKLKKSLGQNLLIDKNIIKKIVLMSALHKKDIIEIGPAAGLMVNETHKNFANAYNDTREHILSSKVIKHLEKIQNG